MNLRDFSAALAATLIGTAARAAEYQWSALVPPAATTAPAASLPAAESPRAFLWIPPDCQRVRAVVFAEHNMLEENLLEDPRFRAELAKLGIAEVWVSPSFDHKFDSSSAFDRLDATLRTLAVASGYDELATAPIAPMGHSAHASMPWNFAAARPGRTLCAPLDPRRRARDPRSPATAAPRRLGIEIPTRSRACPA